ncbi:MAG: SDR family oxidoreductase [Deltaproteobacteria bacterium]|nr:SDR family oxidoreductase [Deltaproteobacteria bacterium]
MNTIPTRQVGRHFSITGAGTGIGRAIALRLSAEGARVSIFGRRTEPLEETKRLLVEAGATADSVFVASMDVRDDDSVTEAFANAVTALGPLRGFVANAGIGGANFPGEDDRFTDIVSTNVGGTYRTLRAAQALLSDEGTRHLVVLSSILGRIGVPWYTGYCASKTALLGLTRALALELADQDIQVNAICPGWVETEMAWQGIDGMATALKTTREEAFKIAMSEVPMGRMSQPEHIAGLVAYLVSDDATGVTGQGLDMNGGAFLA